MQKLAVTLALITATFIANANSTAGYTTVIDKPIGDDIGWVHKIFVDDLNQDNNQDILIMFGGRRGVHYLGNGDGTLSEGTWFSGDYTPYADTLLADFNGDGRPDLFNKDFYPGSQDLSFAQRVTSTPDLRQCRKSLAMDFNSDGLIDVVCAVDDSVASRNDNSYGLFMHTNNGDLSFSLDIISLKNELTETRVETMAHGDIDNNGSEDIVQIVRSYSAIGAGARTESYKITSYPNQSHSTTPNYSPVATIDTMALHDVNNPWSGSSLQSMQLADTNNDGNLDVVALTGVNWTSVSPGFITVFHGNGDGTFTEQPVTTMLPSPYASAFKVTDLNADGKADLVVTFREDYTLSQQLGTQLAFGAGDSTFGPLQSLPAPQSNVWEVAAGDINSDGRLDILTLSGWNSGGRLVAFSDALNTTVYTGPARVICEFSASDPDGDGWGWENGDSCVVTQNSSAEQPVNVLIPRNPAYPLCSSNQSDFDDDGWGWENNATCQVAERIDSVAPVIAPRPVCQRPWADSDGDGWGYENGQSCIVVRQ